jgi:hypothetical protein
VEEDLPLVVGRAAADEAFALLDRDERVGVPLVERLDGLHVVVAVHDDGGGGRVVGRPFREHRGQARVVRGAGLPDLHDGEPGLAQVPGEPLRGAPNVAVSLGVGGDRRDREPLLERGEEPARVGLDVFAYVHESCFLAGRSSSGTLVR